MGDKATVNPWFEFDPADYYFGDTVLRIDITDMFGRPENHHGNLCLMVEGVVFNWDGQPLGKQTFYIRVSALKAAGVPGL